MKKIIALIFFTLFVLFACKNEPKPFHFIYLDKLSGRVGYPEYISEKILIENPPEDRCLLDSIMHDYRVNKSMNLCSIDSSINKYSISFYKKNKRTSFFIENKEDKHHLISESYIGAGYAKESLGLFFFHRSKDNPKIWYSTYPTDFNDTIYCE